MSQAKQFQIIRNSHCVPDAERQKRVSHPGFGSYFGDHMAVASWSKDSGWHNARIQAFESVHISPAATLFHNAQSIFEGLKAYRQPSGSAALFRPYENARRFARSAKRLAMPEMPAGLFVEAVEGVVRADRDWIPHATGHSLYVRPMMFATEAFMGMRPSETYSFLAITSPAAPIFAMASRPLTVWVTKRYVRAARGGTGDAKCTGNYSASLLARLDAANAGCQEAVWLDADERKWVEEMSGMNLFFVWRSDDGVPVLTTPPLTGTVLSGVTRASILELSRHLGWRVAEQPVSLEEWQAGCRSGSIREVFACGTAAIITPIASVKVEDGASWDVGCERPETAQRLRELLIGIQEGTAADPFGWRHPVRLD